MSNKKDTKANDPDTVTMTPEQLAELTKATAEETPVSELRALPQATAATPHAHAQTLALILNGNIDPRTLPEMQRDEIRAFLRNAADALAGTKGA